MAVKLKKPLEYLITGGTGSLGRALVKELGRSWDVKGIRIYSRDELKQYHMAREIESAHPVSYLIGDIRDAKRLKRAMEGVDIVIHAAAMKQVPACEQNPIEAVETNIRGTENVINAAIDAGVKHVMFVSTDKAVNPINLYGATKMTAEKLVIHSNVYSPKHTTFSCCRYGNVLGSRGSVVPLFRQQAAEGKELTLTDPDMTRFWITLKNVSQFLLNMIHNQVPKLGGGWIYIPRMPSCNMYQLARMIAPESGIERIGIRPGEKMHETLIGEEESAHLKEFDTFFAIDAFNRRAYNSELWDHNSLTNAWQLSQVDLQAMLEEV